MFYYYSVCLHLGKTKENFCIAGIIIIINILLGFLIQGISRVIMCPMDLKMQRTIHFRISEKSWVQK
jgi:hypothetical protein